MAATPVGNPVLEDGHRGAVLRRAASSHPRGKAPGLISTCLARATAARRQKGRSEQNKRVKTTTCAGTGAAQRGVPSFVFTLDNCCYRA